MNRRLLVLIGGLFIAGCASTPSPTPVAAPPFFECLGGLSNQTCSDVLPIALDAVKPSGWTPTHIWINSGFLCPDPACLFDPTANFPYPLPPGSGKWIANAEIAFAGTDEHAGLHFASVGDQVQAVLIGYAVPPVDWCSGECPTSSSTDGPYRLELVLPHLDWRSSEPISGTAILSAQDGHSTISGSGNPIGFAYDEVGGDRGAHPIWTADCATKEIDSATPLNQPLGKSGVLETDFQRAFLPGPQIRLPAGTWDITAIADFLEGSGCTGVHHAIRAAARITVTD